MEDKNRLRLFKITVLEKDRITDVSDLKNNIEIKHGKNEEYSAIMKDNKTPDVAVLPDMKEENSSLPPNQDINNHCKQTVRSAGSKTEERPK